mmetsp:Transcript_105544/g.293886  ORF Transcript_105544/g.293886 Transcript_105544/m.293886 type:complete len:722 (+) Transcript_105544:391-2556(+)
MDDALVGAGVGDVRVEAQVRVLVHNDVELLAEASELLAELLADRTVGSEDAWHLRVHVHPRDWPILEGQPVSVPVPALDALPDLLAHGLGDHSHYDLAVFDLKLHLHQLVHRPGDDPLFAIAHVVRTSRRDARLRAVLLCGVDHLLVVPVAEDHELFPAGRTDPRPVLPHAVPPPELGLGAPCPGAGDLVPVLVAQDLRGVLSAHLLPRDRLPVLAWEEANPVDGACRDLLVATVDHPVPICHLVVRAENVDLRRAPVAGGVEAAVDDAVQADVEGLAAGLAEDHRVRVAAVVLRHHLLELVPARPRTLDHKFDVHGEVHGHVLILQGLAAEPEAALICQRGDIVRRELVTEAIGRVLLAVFPCRLTSEIIDRAQGHGARQCELLDLVPVHALAAGHVGAILAHGPDLGVGVGARHSEGGDSDETSLLVVVVALGDHVRRPARGVQVRVEGPQVAVRQTHAVLGHQDAFEEAGRARVGLQVADVALGAREDYRVVALIRLLHSSQGADLDGISQRGAGAVALGGRDVMGVDASLPQGGLDAQLLGRPVWGRHTGTAAVLVHLVADGASLLQLRVLVTAANHDVAHARALASGVPVARGVKRETAALQGEHVLGGAADVRARVDDHVGAARQGTGTVCIQRGRLRAAVGGLLDGVHGGTEGRQPGGAGRVARPRRSAEVQGVGEALAGDVHVAASLPFQPGFRVEMFSIPLLHQKLVPPFAA